MTKDQFLIKFEEYSDKFLDAIPIASQAYVIWMLYSEDFYNFTKTGKLPGGKSEHTKKD